MYSLTPMFRSLANKAIPFIGNTLSTKVTPILFSKAGKVVDWAAHKIGSKFGN